MRPIIFLLGIAFFAGMGIKSGSAAETFEEALDRRPQKQIAPPLGPAELSNRISDLERRISQIEQDINSLEDKTQNLDRRIDDVKRYHV